MEKNLLEQAGSKMVWRGGHGGLKLEAYEGGVAAVGTGDGQLIAAINIRKTGSELSQYDFVAMLERITERAYNRTEASMIHSLYIEAMNS